MSDPVTNAEIEDVLSSIRRLVSEEPGAVRRSRRQAVEEADPEPEKLVLTPALRVPDPDPVPIAESEIEAEADPGADPHPPEPDAQFDRTLESRIAELENAISQSDTGWEPDGSEAEPTDETASLDEAAPSDGLFGRIAEISEIVEIGEPEAVEPIEAVEYEPTGEHEVEAHDIAEALNEDEPQDYSAEVAVEEVQFEPGAVEPIEAVEYEPTGEHEVEAHDIAEALHEDEPLGQPAEVAVEEVQFEPDDDPDAQVAALAEIIAEDAGSEAADHGSIAEVEPKSLDPEHVAKEPAAVAEAAETLDAIAQMIAPEPSDAEDVESGVPQAAEPDPQPHEDPPSDDVTPMPELQLDDEVPAAEVLQEAVLQAVVEETAEEVVTDLASILAAEMSQQAAAPPEETPVPDDSEPVAEVVIAADDVVAATHIEPDPMPDPEFAPEPIAETEVSGDDTLLDEETLRQLVSEVVRQELEGALGKQITRGLRRMVRREIQRAFAARDAEQS